MLISSILGPGTIFLMVVGAISISFNIDTKLGLIIVTIPVALFSAVCLVGRPKTQVRVFFKRSWTLTNPLFLLWKNVMFTWYCLDNQKMKVLQLVVAEVIGALFAMLMTAVIVGTALQIQKDGIYSPHAIFLFAVIVRQDLFEHIVEGRQNNFSKNIWVLKNFQRFFSFFIAAVLHPLEFTCIIPGILYFMAIPCMYMMLPIYSLCNLNTVSWGTRENPSGKR